MRNSSEARRRWLLIAVVTVTVLCIPPSPATPSSPHQQAAALADLMSGIATCAVPPCIGTEAEDFYSLVRGQFASDGDFYTDFGVAYPGFAHLLKGVVMWEVDGTVDAMLFMLTGFHAPPGVVIAELEGARFECEEEKDPEEGQQEWECWRPGTAGDGFEFYLYIGNGVLLVEL